MMFLMMLLLVLLFTLLEHKVLALMQLRCGPNSALMGGLANSLMDFFKHSQKDINSEDSSNWVMMYPWMAFSLSLILVSVSPTLMATGLCDSSSILFLVVSISMMYPIMLMSTYAGSKYSLLGTLRAVAQMLSYDVGTFIIIIYFASSTASFALTDFFIGDLTSFIFNVGVVACWWAIAVAETHRAPMDLGEGESELVAGFYTEIGGMSYVMIVLSEYIMMIMYAYMLVAFFIHAEPGISTSMFLFMTLYCYVWVRASFPRMRYDMLMRLVWYFMVPILLGYCMVSFIM